MTWLSAPNVVALVIVVALNAYALTGGADFGGGVWDLLATGPRRDRQRTLINHAIAPIWEANHVWLIVAVVVLFTGFPEAFASISTVLHIPLAMLLVGIVLRGSAFVFRHYGNGGEESVLRWGRVFSVASVVSPLCLGIVLGAVATGSVGAAMNAVGRSASFAEVYVRPWTSAFAIGVGVFALSLFAMLAGVYLAVDAPDDELRADFRARAIGAALVADAIGAMLMIMGPSRVAEAGALSGTVVWAVRGAAVLVGALALGALAARRYRIARAAAAGQVSLVLWGWVAGQYPFIIPPTLTVNATAAPARTLHLLIRALVVGGAVLVPSLIYLFTVFPREGTSDKT